MDMSDIESAHESTALRGELRVNELMKKYVHPLYALRERVKGYEVSAMKAAMEILGMPAGPVRPPLTNCRPQDVADLRDLMKVYEAFREAKIAAG